MPIVFDNLIHKSEMPVTIGVFIDPGTLPPTAPDKLAGLNRSYEYDSLSDRYVRFVLTEILPESRANTSSPSTPTIANQIVVGVICDEQYGLRNAQRSFGSLAILTFVVAFGRFRMLRRMKLEGV